jgi:CheY-like chemotaxis protein
MPRRAAILLDLNHGATDGLQILARLKAGELLKTIPVIVLSASRHPADIHHSYHHASAYIVKPVDLDNFGRMIEITDACFPRWPNAAAPATTPSCQRIQCRRSSKQAIASG